MADVDGGRSSFRDTLTALEALGEPTRLRLAALLARPSSPSPSSRRSLASRSRGSRAISSCLSTPTSSSGIARAPGSSFLAGDGACPAGARHPLPRWTRRIRSSWPTGRASRGAAGADARRRRILRPPCARLGPTARSPCARQPGRGRAAAGGGPGPFRAVLDLGTGTGRILTLLAGRADRAVGIDANAAMLSVARANIERAGLRNVQVRQGDLYALPIERDGYDVVILHQVLHYLDDPSRAIRERRARSGREAGSSWSISRRTISIPPRRACASPPRLRTRRDRRGPWRGRPRRTPRPTTSAPIRPRS